jgi:5-(carboxyamino)imidazole ribonucleotide synthase
MEKFFYDDLKLGIIGGGQLGRMLIQTGVDWNIHFSALDPDAQAPCHLLSAFTVGKLTDYDAVFRFGMGCDLLTIEIENVNTKALKELQKAGKKIYPQPDVIELIQNKVDQKQFYKTHGIPTSPFILTASREEVQAQKNFLPAVNKLAREGYDGRGVQVLKNEADLPKAFDAPGFMEKWVDFDKEIAVIVARNPRGEVSSYPVVEMIFHPEANLVEYLFCPAQVAASIASKAQAIAKEIIEKLDMVGLLAVEMFVTRSGEILVNEMAPRPHNSGHHTLEGNVTSQYEQLLRAILDLPLGDTAIVQPSAMVNVLGSEGYSGVAQYEGLEKVMAVPGAHVHLYGKRLTKPFRKMGHVTIVDPDLDSLKKKAQFVKETLLVKA